VWDGVPDKVVLGTLSSVVVSLDEGMLRNVLWFPHGLGKRDIVVQRYFEHDGWSVVVNQLWLNLSRVFYSCLENLLWAIWKVCQCICVGLLQTIGILL